jgi:nitrogen fixation NifU-like protein
MAEKEDDLYQEFIIELWKHPRNFGKIQKADKEAEIYNSSCGDRINLYLKIRRGVVTEASFTGLGCAISQASASLFTSFIKGKKISELEKISRDDVLSLIKIDLSKNPTRMRCALLPYEAMKKAIKN